MPGIAFDGSEDLPNIQDPQPKIEATLMKDQMQYIVIEGRKPQDNSKPVQALLILPKWISPTLACAGIVGRVIELTDGNIIEQGAIPMDEQGMLEALREDMQLDAESQQEEVSPTAVDPNAVQPADDHVKECPSNKAAINVSQLRDDAYREGMQAARTSMVRHFAEYGMPEGAGMGGWFKAQMEELERHRNAALPAKLNALLLEFGGTAGGEGYEFLRNELQELAQFRKDRPETLAKLQAAEDNLDAWRDAAGANDKIHQYTDEKTGRITRLAVAVEGDDENFQALNEALTFSNRRIEQLRNDLKKIRKLVKAAL